MIIWVDDDLDSYIRSYRLEVEEGGYNVKSFHGPDKALTYFRENYKKISGAVIDLMLPTGTSFSADDTLMGTQTGKLIIEEFLKIKKDLPTVILTISDNNDILAWAKTKGIEYLLKQETYPSGLLETLERMRVAKDFQNES